jgi:hypothetical protein
MKRHTISSVLLLLVMVSVYACNNKAVVSNPTIGLKLRDSLYINIGHPDSLKQASMYEVHYNNEPYLLIWMAKYFRIVLVPMMGPRKGRPVHIPALDSFMQQHQIHDVCYYNEDSLFGHARDEGRQYLFDINGNIKKSWRMNTDYENEKNILVGGGIFAYPISYDSKHSRFYYEASAFPSENGYEFFHKPHALALQLSGDSAYISTMFSYYPNGYECKYFGITASSTSTILFGNRNYTSFYLSDSLYSYATDTPGKPAGQYNARSNYAIQPTDSFNIKEDANKDYIMEFFANHFAYGFLTAASTSPYLFRIAYHKYHFYNEDSTINMAMQRPWSMVVLDTALQIKGEIPFLDQTFDCTNIIPVNNGFWINTLKDNRQFYFYEMEFK